MGLSLNDIKLRGGLEPIMEGVSYVLNSNGEIVSGINCANKEESRSCYKWIGGLTKFNALNLRSTISTMDS